VRDRGELQGLYDAAAAAVDARDPDAGSGRDWMPNSGILRLDHERAGSRTHAVSAALFASYPLWLWRGWKDGRR
jgi:hypothetical protein